MAEQCSDTRLQLEYNDCTANRESQNEMGTVGKRRRAEEAAPEDAVECPPAKTTEPKKASFGRRLASTEKSVRDTAVKELLEYLAEKTELSQGELVRIWKGLFFCK